MTCHWSSIAQLQLLKDTEATDDLSDGVLKTDSNGGLNSRNGQK